MNTAKLGLRKRLLDNRLDMPVKDRKAKSQAITDQLRTAVDWDDISSVHIFESIDMLGEVDTKPFIDYLRSSHPKLELYHPRKFEDNWYDVDDKGNRVDGLKYDVIIVPTLGFDNSLNRLGHGGGHYDKFLSDRKSARLIGLCFELGHVDHLPLEPHDIPLNCIISEKQIYFPALAAR